MRIAKHLRVAFIVALVAAGRAYAICENNPSVDCMRAALESADEQLNFVFKRLLTSATPEASSELRHQQRLWLQRRNASCGLSAAGTSAANWRAMIAGDTAKANCVYDQTITRVNELQDTPTDNSTDEFAERQYYLFPASRDSGRVYAEVSVNVKGADHTPETTMVQVGVSDSKSFVGMQLSAAEMARRADPNGIYVVGLAVDMDHGKFYYSENGRWLSNPGSVEGSDFARGARYTIRVHTPGKLLSRFMQMGVVRINTGNEPFKYPTPAGYQPFYKDPENVAGGSRLDWIVPSNQKVANKTVGQWGERYWAWLLVRTPERNPYTDTTGAFCADGQAGPVWFLAGGNAKDHVVRHCTIPIGKYLLLPAYALLFESKEGTKPCPELESEKTGEIGAASIDSVYVSIDGQRFDSFYDNRAHTDRCAPIRGDAGETVVRNAVYFGAWILVRPMPAGEHTLSFGGSVPDLQQERGVTYILKVE